HLAVGERVEVLAMNPGFSAWAEEVTRTAGGYGSKTKKSVTDPKGMLLFGAASVMYGSDRAAAAELRYAWPLLIPKLKRAGVSVSDTAPNDAGWQYFRSVY